VVEHAAQTATVAVTAPAPMAVPALVFRAKTFAVAGAAHAALALQVSMIHIFSVRISIYLNKRYIEIASRQEAG
jgi:hypothetical protein